MASKFTQNPWETLVQDGLKIYGSDLSCLNAISSSSNEDKIRQEGARNDYKIDSTGTGDTVGFLHLWPYGIYDSMAWTYVMTYVVDGNGMNKTEKDCPLNHQCFENPEGSKRIVVAPYGQEITVGNVVENVKVQATTNGILLASYNDGYWELRPIGGNITAPGGGQTKNLFVSGNKYHYTDLNGNYHADSTKGAYLPHIPLLLLR